MSPIRKPIHLLYVPTIFCNMGCSYCYLGEKTDAKMDTTQAVATLRRAIDSMTANGYLPFNLSFHGGEVTTLPPRTFETLLQMAHDYYATHKTAIEAQGFRVNPVHIKTNLFNIDPHYDALLKYGVSISGSVDLPLALHDKYRRDKQGRSTRAAIEATLRKLCHYPHHRKISCVVTKEHLAHIDTFIADIRYIHEEIGFDMTRFNVMFAFDAEANAQKFGGRVDGTQMLSPEEQVLFYRRVRDAFTGTPLESGLREHWFKEFTPEYCCSAVNCGNKFFLLQSDGDVYACPRGQASSLYHYGNLFHDPIETIIENGFAAIERNENLLGISDECRRCEYFSYCNLGCPYVRTETGADKSYTCALQKELYRDNPEKYPPLAPDAVKTQVDAFMYRNKIAALTPQTRTRDLNVTPELYDPQNGIRAIIERDPLLQQLYSDTAFRLEVDGRVYPLHSPILKTVSPIVTLGADTPLFLHVRDDLFTHACDDEINNTLHLMVLRNTSVVYGDEGRTKQEHLFDYSLYAPSFVANSMPMSGYYHFDLAPLLRLNASLFQEDVRNNLFATTKTLRDYHYAKHRKNAFYHLQAINLPFPNIEFYWSR